jgi:hypothetical protein
MADKKTQKSADSSHQMQKAAASPEQTSIAKAL